VGGISAALQQAAGNQQIKEVRALNFLLEIIYYLVFLGFGIFLVTSRDVLASKIVDSQKMTDFLYKKSSLSAEKEFIYAKRLTLGIGLIFIAFGFYKVLESVSGFEP